MAKKTLLAAFGVTVAAIATPAATASAPVGTPTTLYCLSMEPLTGSHIEMVQCRTRAEWASLDVDVDQEWRENGVGTIPPTANA